MSSLFHQVAEPLRTLRHSITDMFGDKLVQPFRKPDFASESQDGDWFSGVVDSTNAESEDALGLRLKLAESFAQTVGRLFGGFCNVAWVRDGPTVRFGGKNCHRVDLTLGGYRFAVAKDDALERGDVQGPGQQRKQCKAKWVKQASSASATT